MSKNLKKIIYMALFIALSYIGANIKIPSPTGTVAFDSMPGFLAALLLDPLSGAVCAFSGHIFTSLVVGFPLTLPLHILIGIEMAVFASIFGIIYTKNSYIGDVIAILLNGVAAPASFIPIKGFGKPFFLAMVLPLLVASFANIFLADMVYRGIKKLTGDKNVF